MSEAFAPESFWREETLRDWIERADPKREALRAPGKSISFGELHRAALTLAAYFRSLGLAAGDVIAIQLPNCAEFVVTYLACSYVGAIMQTLHMPYRAAEVEPLLRHGNARALVCLAATKDFSPAAMALSLQATLPSLKHVIAAGPNPPQGALAFPVADAAAPDENHRSKSADRFLLLYTSGTIAAPKGVPVEYRKFLANARLSAPELGIDASSVLLSAAPFTHLYGLYSINLALAAGAAIALLPVFAPPGVAEAVEKLRPTGLFTAPAHMSACLAMNLLGAEQLSSLDFLMISGSACAPSLAKTLQDRMPGGKVVQLWGMSEMQAGTFTRPHDPLDDRLTTAGRASAGTQLRVSEDGRELPVGQEGELEVRGCSVFSGYLGNEAATAAAFTADGWFRTGDLARMDARGNIVLTGRLKDVINRGGVKFNPADIEALIERHPAVAQCAIVPVPDNVLGERACGFVVLKPGAAPLDIAALRAFLTEHQVAKLKWPERLEIVTEMPMTPTRKIKKAELAKRVQSLP